MSVGRRIEDYALVGVASFDFPAGKLQGVLHNPADAVQAAAFHIFARPVDNLPHRIQMRDIGSGAFCGYGRGSGVGK